MSTSTSPARLADGLDRRAAVAAQRRETSRTPTTSNSLLENANFLKQLNGDLPRPVYARKTIGFATDPNQHYKLRHLILHEGRWPSSRTLGWDAVDAAASGAQWAGRAGLKTCEPHAARRRTMLNPPSREASADGYQARRKLWRRWLADGKTVWSWRPLLASSRRRRVNPTGSDKTFNPPMTVTRRIRRRGERAISR
jgi:hypothetical protein